MLHGALRLLRIFHDIKLKDLATELDISMSYLSEIENGNKNPSIELIEKYAKFFDLTPSTILYFADELKSKNNKTKRSALMKFMRALEKFAETKK